MKPGDLIHVFDVGVFTVLKVPAQLRTDSCNRIETVEGDADILASPWDHCRVVASDGSARTPLHVWHPFEVVSAELGSIDFLRSEGGSRARAVLHEERSRT